MAGASPFVWVVLGALLLSSGTLSSSETALFSLTPAERRRAGEKVARLLADSRSLLVTILLGNLVVNLLFFAFAARVRLGEGPYGELWSGLGALVAIVLFGEVLPKTLALRARVSVARLASVFLSVLVALGQPFQRAADRLIELVYRLLGEAARAETRVTTESLARALARSAEHGLLLGAEAEILAGLVELGEVRVREIMTPRVDMLLVDRSEPDRSAAVGRALAARVPWLVAIDQNPDRVLGLVRVRDLLVRPDAPLEELIAPVRFVPEVASALHALHFLREERVAEAVVVDEWGGTAGLVTLEDIWEEVVGELRAEGEVDERPVQDLGDGRFLVPGSLSIRDWNELFGHRVVPTEFETLGGFVTALLGRIPRAGAEARAGGLVFRVDEVARRRIQTLCISVDETRPDGAAAGGAAAGKGGAP